MSIISKAPAELANDGSGDGLWQPPAWLPPLLFVLVGGGMLVWNPDAWIHPLVDYGRELYVPWQITEGAVLYRDIAYFNGPLSPYLNALWFKLFGVNMHVLTSVNVAVIAGVLAASYALLLRISDRFAATCAGVVFLLLFGFQHTDYLGNFSWVAPYSHEMTHGIALSVLAVWLTSRQIERPSTWWLAAIGLVLGAVFLAKPEVFAAAELAVGIGLLGSCLQRQCLAALPWQIIVVGATGLVLPMLACALLATAMPFHAALQGTLGGWVYLGNDALRALPFYSDGQGTADIGASLGVIAKWSGWFLLVLVPCFLVAVAAGRLGRKSRRWLEAGLVVVVALAVWDLPIGISFAPILVSVLAVTVVWLTRFWRHRDATAVLGLILCAFAVGLLPKIFFNVRFHQYGFGLAFPATSLSVVGLLCWLPRFIERRGWAGGVFRGGGLGLLVILLVGCLKIVGVYFAQKTAVQGGEHETFHCRDSAYTQPTDLVMPWLLQNTGPEDTVLVLPEGISINYFTRRRNPTRQINFMPPEMIMYGEDQVLADLRAAPADYIVVVHRITGEYGPNYTMFGTHYGRKVMQWVSKNYVGIKLFGAEPLHRDRLEDGRWGALIMQRN